MLTQENTNLLNEIYRAASMGEQAIADVLPSVDNPKLSQKLDSQSSAYNRIAGKSRRMLYAYGKEPEEAGFLEKMGLWGGVKMNLIRDDSTSHVAEMMIQGSNMAITDITKKLNDLGEADAGARELAEEFLDCENKHIESMKQYL